MAVLLEDFATLRTVHDGTKNLFTVYNGEGQTQVGSLDSSLGAFKSHITATGSSAIYVYCNARGDNEGYNFPYGYIQYYIKSGVFDANCNRLTFWVKTTDSVNSSTTGGHSVEWGTYIRNQSDSDANSQGDHYYHFLDGPWGKGSGWTYVIINRHPQHRVGEDSNLNWPDDPSFQTQLVVTGYLSGTCTLTNGSATVTGSGTSFNASLSANNLVHFDVDGAVVTYQILSIASNTSMTLTTTWSGTNTSTAQVERAATLPSIGELRHYFDGLSHFYFDGTGGFAVPNDWWFDLFQFSTVTNEPDYLVSNICCAHDGTKYWLNWNGPKNTSQNYSVYYSTTASLKNADGSYNGNGTLAGTKATTADAYSGVSFSFTLAEVSTIYLFILPTGSSTGAEIIKDSAPNQLSSSFINVGPVGTLIAEFFSENGIFGF